MRASSNVGRHPLYWVHAGRLMHKLDTFTEQHRAAQKKLRGLSWNFYGNPGAFRLRPSQRRVPVLRAGSNVRFDVASVSPHWNARWHGLVPTRQSY